MNKRLSYWGAQIFGWGALVALGFIFREEEIKFEDLLDGLSNMLAGILLTHGFRWMILKLNWLRFNVVQLTPLVLIASLVMGSIFFLSQYGVDQLLKEESSEPLGSSRIILLIINNSIFLFFWSILYFGYHFFEKSREQEIRNIKLVSSKNEVELQNLRTQLNPHFMFNSMNSIRALIDEDPGNAKIAVTKLSNLLRSTLIAGRKDLVPLQDEMEIVKDYLDLEKIRFEERLHFSFQVEPALLRKKFPPLLLQTLVENAVKHGVSKLAKGGDITVLGEKADGFMILTVLNSGVYEPDEYSETTGIGLDNSRRRLDIMFGPEGMMTIGNDNGMVRTEVKIPIID